MKTLICTLLILLSITTLHAENDHGHNRSTDEKISDVLSGIPYREMLYTQSFQKRFSLPESGIEPLDTGLMAIAFELTNNSNETHPIQCKLHLYVDSELIKLSLPNQYAGIEPRSRMSDGSFFTVRSPLNDKDSEFYLNTMRAFSSRLLIQSNNYPTTGITTTESLNHYNVSIYPGISHFAFNVFCDALDLNNSGQTTMWLNKTSDQNNLPVGNSSGVPEHLFKLNLPLRLGKSVSPLIALATQTNKRNSGVFNSHVRKIRELLDRENGFGIPPK